MQLRDVLKNVEAIEVAGDLSGEVSSIHYDSRKCREGSLFVAVRGLKRDGHDYIREALARGAKYVVGEKAVPSAPGVTVIRVGNSRRTLGLLGRNFYRDPSACLSIIGVTGTNGKTTVTFLLESILKAAGSCVGVIGTINYRYGGKTIPAPNTTPESLDLQRVLREMADDGVNHVIMEVSSHALDLGRVDDCRFAVGIFTNLSQDHLDYHGTMENYFSAKKRFFRMLEKDGNGRLRPGVILNVDDPWGRRLYGEIAVDALTYGLEQGADVSADQIRLSADGITARLLLPGGQFAIRSSLIGKFNLYNVMAAAAACSFLHVPDRFIQVGIENMKTIPGRMEKVNLEGQPVVFVDYAHTEDALKRVLQNISEFKKGRIITVFGCGGDRDRGKRPLMGKTSAQYSDLTIVTSDNPRTEDPLAIIAEIERGINSGAYKKYAAEELGGFGQKGYAVIVDRKSAIEKAISIAAPSDIVLIAGKGHESYQIVGGRTLPFDDRAVSREVLEGLRDRRLS
ncbi:MAG: UDP-N-acetylmuramoyl-L-alanyl-D-glutamate--2,6-diaminopimelate ligase [Syntrophales bacterium]